MSDLTPITPPSSPLPMPSFLRGEGKTVPTPNAKRPTPLLVVEMILINLLWAGASVAAKAGLTQFGAFQLAFWRFFPAGLLLMGYVGFTSGFPKIERRDVLGFLSVGFFGIALTYSVYY